MQVIPYLPEHLRTLQLQPAQSGYSQQPFDDAYSEYLAHGQSFSAVADGRVIACAGVMELWQNRGMAWALLSSDAGRHFVKVHRAVSRFLDLSELPRIEAYVDEDFAQGHRWITALGFTKEGLMRKFTPEGRDAVLYSRVR